MAGAGALGMVASVLYPRPLEPEYSAFENPLSVPALEAPVGMAIGASALLVVLGLLSGAGSLVLRFRRARGVERLQLRWLVVGAVLAAVALLVAVVALQSPEAGDLFQVTFGLSLALLPLATGAAILRYRLYDIDRIVSRTLAYALLTVLLGGGYAAVVLGLGQLLGRDSSLVVAGATLAVAARVPAGPPAGPGGGRPALQPPPPRRRPDHRRLRCPPPRPGRAGHPDRRAPDGGRPDDAADPGRRCGSGRGRGGSRRSRAVSTM